MGDLLLRYKTAVLISYSSTDFKNRKEDTVGTTD